MTHRYVDRCCRYYGGEEDCPYNREEEWLWKCERDYCAYCAMEDSSSVLDACMDVYTRDGLGDFASADGVSLSLKAFLYTCYMKRADDGNAKGFRQWYSWYY